MNNAKKTLGDLGERGFISAFRHLLPPDGGALLRSIGDDCLMTAPIDGRGVLATVDTFVEGVHFDTGFMAWETIGARCMTASVSDIAAMAGKPLVSLVSLSLSNNMPVDDALALSEGLRETAAWYGCPVGGGETTSTPGSATVTVTVLGSAVPGGEIRRSGARPGDSIYVTGSLGDAMAGLDVCRNDMEGLDALKRKFMSPEARAEAAAVLAETFRLNAMIDISDGLAVDIRHICNESGCGADIVAGAVPMSEEFLRYAEMRGIDPVIFAISSGEEFELLFTSGDDALTESIGVTGVKVHRIGTVTATPGIVRLILPGGMAEPVEPTGYEHFTT